MGVGAVVAIGAVALVAVATTAAGPKAPEYAVSRDGGYETKALLSVGDQVSETSNRKKKFQMVGIPDGLGAVKDGDDTLVYMNHEFGSTVKTQPVIGGPLYKGSFVSKWVLKENGKVESGERAYDTVYVGNTPVGPAAEDVVGNTTRPFSRLCSGSLGTQADGFSLPIYFAGEEDDSMVTSFDPDGGQAVAIYNNEAHVLPKLGKSAFENILPQRRTDGTSGKTVLLLMEDGPATPLESQLYMYVGQKSTVGTTLDQNGLTNGQLYALKVTGRTSEAAADVTGAPLGAEWVPVASPETKTSTQLNTDTVAAGAYGFARVEDGAFDKDDPNRFYFVTTGQNAVDNNLGRIYQLDLNVSDPAGAATLKLVVNADAIIKAGGDAPVSPDNIDTASGLLMVQEDGTTPSRIEMGKKNRDGSIWRFPIVPSKGGLVASPDRIVELNPPGRDGVAVGPGVWETSGIIDTSTIFGPETWLFDVQAHGPTIPPNVASQGEDGQLLLLRPSGR
jgi:hypothetical protein